MLAAVSDQKSGSEPGGPLWHRWLQWATRPRTRSVSARERYFGPSYAVRSNPAAAHGEFVGLLTAAEDGDWPAVVAFFDRLTTLGDVMFAVGTLGDWRGIESRLEPLATVATPDRLARLLLADRLIKMGWGVGLHPIGPNPTVARVEEIRSHLGRAEQILLGLTSADPDDAVAWSLRLHTARGLNLGLDEARRRYDAVARVDPHNVWAQSRLLRQLSPASGGSLDQMHAFAGDCADAAPAGALNGMLIAQAQVEHAFAATGRAAQAWQYLADRSVRRTLTRA